MSVDDGGGGGGGAVGAVTVTRTLTDDCVSRTVSSALPALLPVTVTTFPESVAATAVPLELLILIEPIALLTVNAVDCPTSSETLASETPSGGLTVTVAVLVPCESVTDRVATPTASALTLIAPRVRLAETAEGFELARVTAPRTRLTVMVDLSPGSNDREAGDRFTAWAATVTSGMIRLDSHRRLLEGFISFLLVQRCRV